MVGKHLSLNNFIRMLAKILKTILALVRGLLLERSSDTALDSIVHPKIDELPLTVKELSRNLSRKRLQIVYITVMIITRAIVWTLHVSKIQCKLGFLPLTWHPRCTPCMINDCYVHLSRDARKPVFGVSDQVRHKPGCTSSEAG